MALRKLRHYLVRITEEPRPLRFLMSRLLRYSGLCKLFEIQRRGYRLRFFPTAFSANLWLSPSAFQADEDFVSTQLTEGNCFVDVGANIGMLAFSAAARVGAEGRVFAFEAHPVTARYLSENLALNRFPQVTLVACALGSEAGELVMTDLDSDDQNHILAGDHGGVRIPVGTLDAMLDFDGTVDLLKIDVEGYEKFVLLGGPKVLARTRAIYFEASDQLCRRFDYDFSELLTILDGAGFDVFRLQDQRWLPVEFGYRCIEVQNMHARKRTSLTAAPLP
jgi:FkbM family methyltransferase